MSALNAEIKKALDSFDIDRARELLRQALKEADAETYFLASRAALDDTQKQEFLTKALELDPFHENARKALKTSSQISVKEEKSDEIILPTAKVMTDTPLFVIPDIRGAKRTDIVSGKEVQVIARDPKTRWINVTFITSVGQRTFGWILQENLGDLIYENKQALWSDLDISQFEFNTQPEIASLINIGLFAADPMNNLFIITFTFIVIAIIWGLMLDSIIVIIIGITSSMIFAFYRASHYPKANTFISSSFSRQQLTEAMRAKNPISDKQEAHQQKMALLSIAGNIATRLVPDTKLTITKNS